MNTAPFRWPPEDPPPSSTAPATKPKTTKKQEQTSGFSNICRELADLWLAPTAPPLSVRIAESGWKPDTPGTWCDRCGSTVGPYEENEFGCAECRGKRLPYARTVRLGEFQSDLRDWIHEVKFTKFRALGVNLGRLLGKQLRLAGLVPESNLIICPMPTSWCRRVSRGIDHSAAIALGVAQELNAPRIQLLSRKHRQSQQSLPASDRRRNVAKSFSRRAPNLKIAEKHVILIDDVTTTGSTAIAAARTLTQPPTGIHRPANVWLAVLAAAPRPGTAERNNPQTPPTDTIMHGSKKRIDDKTSTG